MADDNIEGLLAKRDELLAEVKAAKARAKQLEEERDEWKAKAETASQQIAAIRIEGPLEDMLKEVVTTPWRHARRDIEDHFKFELGADGRVKVLTPDGQPVEIGEGDKKKEAGFDRADLWAAMKRIPDLRDVVKATLASGAGGVSGNATAPASERKRGEPHRVANTFGLR